MKKIISFLKPYTFRFSNVLSIINRPIINSIIYYSLMVFILSFVYHFNIHSLESSASFIDSILSFLKLFCLEYLFSSIFYLYLIYCIFILFNRKINSNFDKIKFKFSHLINLFSHLYTISFILEFLFLLSFNFLEMTSFRENAYIWISIILSFMINIIYPICFMNYIYKNKDIVFVLVNDYTTKNKKNNKLVKVLNFIKNFLLLKHNFILEKLSKIKSIYLLLAFIIFSFIISLFILALNPYYINMYSVNIFDNYTFNEIIINYLDLIKMNCLFLLVPIFISMYYIKMKNTKFIKKYKLNDVIVNIKISSSIYFINLLLILIYSIHLKIMNLSFIKPKILPTQMVGILISPLYYIVIIFMIFFIFNDLVLKFYKKINK